MPLENNQRPEASYDVSVIGAGPAGTITAALLKAAGLNVAISSGRAFRVL